TESQMGWSFLAASAALRRPRVRIYNLVVLFRRCHRMGSAARAQSQGCRPITRMDCAGLCVTSRSRRAPRHRVGSRRTFQSSGTMDRLRGSRRYYSRDHRRIAATSERHVRSRPPEGLALQAEIALGALTLAPLSTQIIATAILLLLFLCFAAQIVMLIAHRPL